MNTLDQLSIIGSIVVLLIILAYLVYTAHVSLTKSISATELDATTPKTVPQNADTGLTFSQALMEIRLGKLVARRQWVGTPCCVGMTVGRSLEVSDLWSPAIKQMCLNKGISQVTLSSYLVYVRADDQLQLGWSPTAQDLMACDWYVVV